LTNEFNNRIEQEVFHKAKKLKKLGLYPKNQEILLKAASRVPAYSLWKFSVHCDINDIEFLFRNAQPVIAMEIIRYAKLSFENIVLLLRDILYHRY
jgi:hypothetical protein